MDQCAQIMADAASYNQMQANATATASEDATTNVSNVAMAAEEIAQSVEQISTIRRATSAEIARHASDEAKSIISTVERLAATVGQINSVSNLIRDVAAQTNLLALNATIEAARAGRGRSRLRRRRPGGQDAGVADREVDGRHHAADFLDRGNDVERGAGHASRSPEQSAGSTRTPTEISVAVQQQDAVSKEIARSANAAAERTREVSASVVQVSDAASQNRSGCQCGAQCRQRTSGQIRQIAC